MAPPMPKPAAAKTTTPPPPPIVPPLQPAPLPQLEMPKLTSPTLPLGSVGGSGTDGTSGSGPGSGGGVGSGVGPGRGSGVGPGTGGGAGENLPPTPTEMFIPPLPVPASVRGKHIVVEFDVDERGRVLGFKHTPTGDGGYDRRLDEVLRNYRFRPGTKPDGTPIRMKGQIVFDLP
jgi:protein TonB